MIWINYSVSIWFLFCHPFAIGNTMMPELVNKGKSWLFRQAPEGESALNHKAKTMGCWSSLNALNIHS